MYFQVIMPIGGDPLREEKQAAIRRSAFSAGVSPQFPSYTSENPVFNLKSALQYLHGAEFVIADLSFERPSCYYELGLAEALGKPVYLLAQAGTNIHQAAAREEVRFFEGLEGFQAAIEAILTEYLKNGEAANMVVREDG
jgi:nucleoside 2-deoxyribosyltransferase